MLSFFPNKQKAVIFISFMSTSIGLSNFDAENWISFGQEGMEKQRQGIEGTRQICYEKWKIEWCGQGALSIGHFFHRISTNSMSQHWLKFEPILFVQKLLPKKVKNVNWPIFSSPPTNKFEARAHPLFVPSRREGNFWPFYLAFPQSCEFSFYNISRFLKNVADVLLPSNSPKFHFASAIFSNFAQKCLGIQRICWLRYWCRKGGFPMFGPNAGLCKCHPIGGWAKWPSPIFTPRSTSIPSSLRTVRRFQGNPLNPLFPYQFPHQRNVLLPLPNAKVCPFRQSRPAMG